MRPAPADGRVDPVPRRCGRRVRFPSASACAVPGIVAPQRGPGLPWPPAAAAGQRDRLADTVPLAAARGPLGALGICGSAPKLC
jgi:hypothetical protein